MRRMFIVITLAIATGGCASGTSSGTPLGDGTGEMLIYVENRQWNDMDILVAGGVGAPQLLGTARGRSTERFRLRIALVHDASHVRLIADAHESTQRIISDPLEVTRSRTAQWRLQKSGLSRLRVR